MAPRKKSEEFESDAPEQVVHHADVDAAPRGPVNPPEPEEPMAQPEPQVGAVNPPEPEPVKDPIDNRTRDGVQVPVNPEDNS